MADYETPFIVKKVKKAGHAHHGGAWKIAYADFVTAMMAFFLLLWLISMTTPEQKKGLADYFAPPNVSETTNGAAGMLAGTAFDDMPSAKMSGSNSDAKSFTAPQSPVTGSQIIVRTTPSGDAGSKDDPVKTNPINIKSDFDQSFHSAAMSIRQAWQALPDITEMANNLVVEETKDGLNIKILDEQGKPMFPEGSKFPFEYTRKAIAAIAPILQKLSSQITISGHTASGSTYSDPHYGAWELSMDRADAVREILGEFGLSDDHIDAVVGRGTAAPLFPNDPYLSGNGRVEITLVAKAPPVPPDMQP